MQPISRLASCGPDSSGSSSAEQIVAIEQQFAECEWEIEAIIYTLLPHCSDAEGILQRTRIVLCKEFEVSPLPTRADRTINTWFFPEIT